MSSYAIEKINSSYSISDYLSEKGIYPRREGGNKKVYLCPLPDHATDSHPSFYVFDKGDHEDFHCFGCSASGSIINIISRFENISIEKAITHLGGELNIDVDSEMSYLVEKAKESISLGGEDIPMDSLMISLHMGRICHDHMRKCDFDKEEIEVCESFFKVIDNMMFNKDILQLNSAFEKLPELIGKRFHNYMDKKEKEEIDSFKAWDI